MSCPAGWHLVWPGVARRGFPMCPANAQSRNEKGNLENYNNSFRASTCAGQQYHFYCLGLHSLYTAAAHAPVKVLRRAAPGVDPSYSCQRHALCTICSAAMATVSMAFASSKAAPALPVSDSTCRNTHILSLSHFHFLSLLSFSHTAPLPFAPFNLKLAASNY